MKNKLLATLLMVSATLPVSAQTRDSYDDFRRQAQERYELFRQQAHHRYDDFRRQANERYMEFMRQSWEKMRAFRGEPVPEEKKVPPVVMPEEDRGQQNENHELPIEEVTPPPPPSPQPEPVKPIEETPVFRPIDFTFTYLGTEMRVRLDDTHRFRMASMAEGDIANAWNTLCDTRYDNLIVDCLRLRSERKLCDWAYLEMLDALSQQFCGKGSNEATLLKAFIFCQSGYKMRLAKAAGRLELLFASQHNIFALGYFDIEGEHFYTLADGSNGQWEVFDMALPGERPLSLAVADVPRVAVRSSTARHLSSVQTALGVTLSVNRNIIDFYDGYPTSQVGSNLMTRWALYANTPLCAEAAEALYPVLRQHIKTMSQWGAANLILDWVQNAFVYEYDDKVWGGDRAFFADETLFYPYADCEDRSILFSRIVRDVLGLDVALIYYPGHLATAVCFTEYVAGDYVTIGGRRFVIADQTYIGAPVGFTMPGMDNDVAKAIVLERSAK